MLLGLALLEMAGFVYADVPQPDWFQYYSASFNSVEINASFYSWPTVASAQAWRRQPGGREFVYTVKVCELITHVKKLRARNAACGTYCLIAEILGDGMGCFLFQLPAKLPIHNGPSTRQLSASWILSGATSSKPEHNSWSMKRFIRSFRKAEIIFCSCSGPRLPDELIRTADDGYLRLHGPQALVPARLLG